MLPQVDNYPFYASSNRQLSLLCFLPSLLLPADPRGSPRIPADPRESPRIPADPRGTPRVVQASPRQHIAGTRFLAKRGGAPIAQWLRRCFGGGRPGSSPGPRFVPKVHGPRPKAQGPGSRAQGSRSRVPGSRVQGPRPTVQGPRPKIRGPRPKAQGPGSKAQVPGSMDQKHSPLTTQL